VYNTPVLRMLMTSGFFFRVVDPTVENCKRCFHLWETRRVINLASAVVSTSFLELQSAREEDVSGQTRLRVATYRVVDACAMMLPPIGFFSFPYAPGAASGLDMTWFVTTTAMPNSTERKIKRSRRVQTRSRTSSARRCSVCRNLPR
jgi:hypothetical protein